MTEIQFKPRKEIREFDGSQFVGKMATIELFETKDGSQRIQIPKIGDVDFTDINESLIYRPNGWVKAVLGKKGETVRRKVRSVELIEHANGGRGSNQRAPSYKEFFDDKRKKRVQKMWSGGLPYIMMGMHGGGDPHRADLIFGFDEFEIEEWAWDFECPEEWYSEMHAEDPQFQFRKGFYEDAEEALHYFADRAHDDLFGERYFPVLVFPKELGTEVGREIARSAKACSRPIVTGKHVVFGTRCKPYEYSDIIQETYNKGGKVARSMDWGWE